MICSIHVRNAYIILVRTPDVRRTLEKICVNENFTIAVTLIG
jgi:hypothetical protein